MSLVASNIRSKDDTFEEECWVYLMLYLTSETSDTLTVRFHSGISVFLLEHNDV